MSPRHIGQVFPINHKTSVCHRVYLHRSVSAAILSGVSASELRRIFLSVVAASRAVCAQGAERRVTAWRQHFARSPKYDIYSEYDDFA